MANQSKTTTDHDEIRRWAEAHGGHPAAVKGTGRGRDPGILRIDFPGFSGEDSLRPISWDEFFKAFDANELAIVYRGRDRFNKLVSRDKAKARRGASTRGGRAQQKKPAARKRQAAAGGTSTRAGAKRGQRSAKSK